MILTCPSCATRYSINSAALGGRGREVRCVKCAHTWIQEPEKRPDGEQPDLQPEETAPTAGAGEPTGLVDRPGARRPRPPGGRQGAAKPGRKRRERTMAWATLAAFAVALVLGGYFGRQLVVDAWPPASRIYALLGVPVLPVNRLGFELANLRQVTETEAGVAVLKITGDIVNITDEARPAPRVRIGIRDKSAKEIHHWTAAPLAVKVAAGGVTSFATRLENPPAEARDMLLTLVAADEHAAEQAAGDAGTPAADTE
jgi:predicted Zn finger-like uncharacterized protein